MTRSPFYSRLASSGLAAARSPTGRSVLLYAIAFTFAGLTPIVLLPVLTRELTPAEVGQVTSWIILAGMIGNVCNMSTPALITVRYFKNTTEQLARLMVTAIAVVVAVHALFAAAVAIRPDLLSEFTSLPDGYSVLAVGAALAFSINLIGLGLMQASQRPGLYLASRVVQSVVEIVGCVALLYLVAATPDARISTYLGALAVCALFALGFSYRTGHLSALPSGTAFKTAMRFSVPIVPHVLAGQLLVNLDRLMVSAVLGIESLGIFMVASQLGMAMSLVIEPLNRALAPWLFGALGDADEAKRRQIVLVTYGLFLGLVVLALVLAGLFFLLYDFVFPPEYAAAKAIIFPIAIGMAFQGMYYGVVNYVFYAEATIRLSLITTGTVAASLLTSYLLVSNFELMGAAISFMLTNAVLFLSIWFLSSRVVPMPWTLRREARA